MKKGLNWVHDPVKEVLASGENVTCPAFGACHCFGVLDCVSLVNCPTLGGCPVFKIIPCPAFDPIRP